MADRAFTEIFNRHSRNSGMGIDDMVRLRQLFSTYFMVYGIGLPCVLRVS